MNIRRRLLLLSVCVAIPLMCVGAANLYSLHRAGESELNESLERQSQLAALALERWLDAQRQPLTTIASYAANNKQLPERYLPFMIATRPYWTDLRVLDAERATVSSEPSDVPALSPSMLDSAFERITGERTWTVVTDRIASQIHVVVDDAPRGSGLENLLSIPEALHKGVMPVDGSAHHIAAGVGLLAVIIMVAWGYVPKRLKLVPAPLAAVVVASLVAASLRLPIKSVSVPGNLLDAVNLPTPDAVGSTFGWAVLGSALAIALIASAETLLSATAIDRLHTGPRAQYNRELVMQGVGNTICGFLGALPMAGVIVRSSANVEAGAKTRMSTMLHGVWILAALVAFPFVLNLIPTTVLAAILVYTGFKLFSLKAVKELAKFGKSEAAIFFATIVAIISTNLLEGVLIGLGLSLLKLIYRSSQLDVRLRSEGGAGEMTLALEGAATFVRLPKLAAALDAVPAGTRLDINVEGLTQIDHACLDLLAEWSKRNEAQGGELRIERDELHRKHRGAEQTERAPHVPEVMARAAAR